MATCLTGCNRKEHAQGYCNTCYARLLRNGKITAFTPKLHTLTEIDPEARTAVCAVDGEMVKVTPRNKERTQWQCTLRANASKRRWKRRRYQLKAAMLGPECEICGGQGYKLCWDHNHETGEFRGTLCNECNLAIGLFKDSPERLRKALSYLTER